MKVLRKTLELVIKSVKTFHSITRCSSILQNYFDLTNSIIFRYLATFLNVLVKKCFFVLY